MVDPNAAKVDLVNELGQNTTLSELLEKKYKSVGNHSNIVAAG
jgi:hypothetical protein